MASLLYGLLIIALGLAPSFLIYLVFNLFIGITMPIYVAPLNVLLQEKVKENMRGRVFSFMQISISSALPLGMLIFGPMADVLKIQSLLLCCGVAVIAGTLAFFFSGKLVK